MTGIHHRKKTPRLCGSIVFVFFLLLVVILWLGARLFIVHQDTVCRSFEVIELV